MMEYVVQQYIDGIVLATPAFRLSAYDVRIVLSNLIEVVWKFTDNGLYPTKFYLLDLLDLC